MKTQTILLLLLILCFISACSQIEEKSEESRPILYENELQAKTDHWEVKLHLINQPFGKIYFEESTVSMKYLKEIDARMGFNYKKIYGNPVKYSVTPVENEIITHDENEHKFKEDQKGVIEEVCYDEFTIRIFWKDKNREPQEEGFIFNDNDNPQCDNIIPRLSKN